MAAPMAMPAAAPDQFAQGNFDPNAMDPGNTNNLLQLARRLHEEHVREGMEKRDALISEGHAAAARVVSEAEQSARGQLGALQQERQELERKVEELRGFEREYRTKLRGYIEGQLRELESSNVLTATPTQAAVAAPQYAPAAPSEYGQPQQQDYAAYPSDYPGFGPAN
jgi:cell division septum initiation protein DivIVA